MTDDLMREQLAYYEARATEYDEVYLRRGRHDRGTADNAAWLAELAVAESALVDFRADGDVLELACGTGHWTVLLARLAVRLMAVDGSAASLAIARRAVRGANVEFVHADIFEWEPPRLFDVVFLGFWLAHVPPSRLGAFWHLVSRSLRVGGRVFLVDGPHTPAADERGAVAEGVPVEVRRLSDGREFRAVKVRYDLGALVADLRLLGWEATFTTSGRFFFGSVVRAARR